MLHQPKLEKNVFLASEFRVLKKSIRLNLVSELLSKRDWSFAVSIYAVVDLN